MKKILAFLIALLVVMPSLGIAYAEERLETDLRYESAHSFIASLGIVEGTRNAAETVTRAEFTDMIVRALALPEGAWETVFSDVDKSTPYAQSISAATALGIVSGTGNSMFRPNDSMELMAALKMAVSALGYDRFAAAEGGYPAGYIFMARKLNLLKDLSEDYESPLSYNKAILLIYRMLNADMCRVALIDDNRISEVRDTGVSLLNEKYNLKKISGVLKTAGHVTMIPGEECNTAKITIGGKDFTTELTDAEQYLGYRVTGWFDEHEEIKHIYVEPKNESVTVKGKDVKSFKNQTLTVYEEETNREESYTMSRAFTFVKNGRSMVPLENDFKFDAGELTLIDNDFDGNYDVVCAESAMYMVVASVNQSEGIIYDNKNGGNSVIMKRENGYWYSLYGSEKEELRLNNLSAGSVLMVYASDGGKYVKAMVSNTHVKGTLEEKQGDEIVVGGVSYKLNGYFSEQNKLEVGAECDFLMAADGTICAFSSEPSSILKYGYLINYEKKGSGLSDTVRIQLVNEGGKKLTLDFAENVMLNGERLKNDDKKFDSQLADGNLPKYQLLRYGTDEDGKLSKIDTASDVADLLIEEKYSGINYGNDSLTRFLSGTKSYWHSGSQVFSPHAVKGGQTILFRVPTQILSGTAERLDEDLFEVIGSDSLESYGRYTIDAYDMDQYMQPRVVVIYDTVGDISSLSVKENQSLVERVTKGVNEAGEDIYNITLWRRGNFFKYKIDAEMYDKLIKTNMVPSSGDIIRMTVDGDGYIKSLVIDAKYDENQKVAIITSNAPKTGQVDDSCYRGRVFVHSDSTLSLIVDQAAGFNAGYSDPIIDNITPFSMTSSVTIAIYNTERKTIRQGRKNMLVDALAVGKENASNIVLKSYSHGIQQIFIYE